ncbi:tRNA (adenine(22)-N(1))-methyltransferase [Amphritea sp. HPY]|uniref:tRNA (adenine(22)-N(1))-methyltransferase n=1 Tax=Amphritea sp. HPY TaxID=3421652 RepID=UPI003D7D7A18
MKQSQRLQQIDRMVTRHYNHIFDCCCDHGFLGQALLQRNIADTVHFVDVVEPIMAELQDQLERLYGTGYPRNSWQVQCQDVAALSLPKDGSTLVIIAGVGGDLLIDLVTALVSAHPDRSLEFILCPVYHNYKVRQALRELSLSLIDEQLVHENRQSYEVLHLASSATDIEAEPISPVGKRMWDLSKTEHQQYLDRTIAHYERMSQRRESAVGSTSAEDIVAQYKALRLPRPLKPEKC